MKWQPSCRDLQFMIETLMPKTRDVERAIDLVQADEHFIEAMLDDDRLFQHLMAEEEILLQISPWLFFTVLLRRVRRDLEQEAFTVERRHRQKVLLFDIDQVIQLLEQEPLWDYLATMLASFTRVQSVTVPVRVRKGIWRRYRAIRMALLKSGGAPATWTALCATARLWTRNSASRPTGASLTCACSWPACSPITSRPSTAIP